MHCLPSSGSVYSGPCLVSPGSFSPWALQWAGYAEWELLWRSLRLWSSSQLSGNEVWPSASPSYQPESAAHPLSPSASLPSPARIRMDAFQSHCTALSSFCWLMQVPSCLWVIYCTYKWLTVKVIGKKLRKQFTLFMTMLSISFSCSNSWILSSSLFWKSSRSDVSVFCLVSLVFPLDCILICENHNIHKVVG